MTGSVAGYDFAHATLDLYDFFWSELCDWYLEIVKPRLYDEDEDASASLLWVLEQVLALAHPFIPFVTEEVYSYLPSPQAEALVIHPFPEPDDTLIDEGAEAEIGDRDRAHPGAASLARPRRGARKAGVVGARERERAARARRRLARSGSMTAAGRTGERRSRPSPGSSCSRPRASTRTRCERGSTSGARSSAAR